MRSTFMYLVLFGFVLSCTSIKMSTASEVEVLTTLITTKSFEFTADWANPVVTQSLTAVANMGLIPPGSTISRINLAGNPNYLKVFGDSVSANLPYFGERQFGGGYGSSTGIEFNAIAEDYVQRFVADKGIYNISFKVKNKTEQYNVMMRVYPNKSTSISVNTSNRLSIRYDGEVKALKKRPKQ
ncbi:DUF4251 domain-containing protein [Maribacter sp. ACAM166]|uniref:DUF4251 domain-containing protein n=1 Tax=Maribacter sp. ACAM166 TaxID=2508996 RepID=UPI0010FEEA8B|nr:DUF4251 domain-containing protein [Maribacter sp. ACAM166]TLP81435.1 DUF4251 domain-containing protein [Maribacter sp. ACAM166]